MHPIPWPSPPRGRRCHDSRFTHHHAHLPSRTAARGHDHASLSAPLFRPLPHAPMPERPHCLQRNHRGTPLRPSIHTHRRVGLPRFRRGRRRLDARRRPIRPVARRRRRRGRCRRPTRPGRRGRPATLLHRLRGRRGGRARRRRSHRRCRPWAGARPRIGLLSEIRPHRTRIIIRRRRIRVRRRIVVRCAGRAVRVGVVAGGGIGGVRGAATLLIATCGEHRRRRRGRNREHSGSEQRLRPNRHDRVARQPSGQPIAAAHRTRRMEPKPTVITVFP